MAEPWIRVHANLGQKPIAHRCASALAVSVPTATGHLVLVWGAVSQFCENGSLASVTDQQIEAWAQWKGKRGKFAKFIREHHLDENGRCREWDDYAGALEDRRAKDRARQAEYRKKRHGDITATSPLANGVTIRNETSTTTTKEILLTEDKEKPPADSTIATAVQPAVQAAEAEPSPAVQPPDFWLDPRVVAFLESQPAAKHSAWRAAINAWLTGDDFGIPPHPSRGHIASGLAEATLAALGDAPLSAKFVRSCIRHQMHGTPTANGHAPPETIEARLLRVTRHLETTPP